MVATYVFAAIFLHVVFITSAQIRSCRHTSANYDYRLEGHVTDTISHILPETCISRCTEAGTCYSLNYDHQNKLCELNNKTKLFAQQHFVFEKNFFYLDILHREYNPCLVEKPCRNDGECKVHYGNGSYSCRCTKHYTGQHCQTLKKVGNVSCKSKELNLCQLHMQAWKVKQLESASVILESCSSQDLDKVSELFLFVGRSDASNYGKYDVVRVRNYTGCTVNLYAPIKMDISGSPCEIVAQNFPNFDQVSLSQSCTMTCTARSLVVGGIMAFRAVQVELDSTSKIDMSAKGYRGGSGGSTAGYGGNGGETFACLSADYGQGGRYFLNGKQGGGAGDGAAGGTGGLNAGGGGGDSNVNNDDGAGGGGGGGHFSGGGGGGAGGGCGDSGGGDGGQASTTLNAYAGGGGSTNCPGGRGGNGGLSGGSHGNNVRGGLGGSATLGNSYGGGGGGGGFQYGSLDYINRLSYGAGGGGGGGSQFGPSGGRGGHGGGLVFILTDKLILNGRIEAKGERGQCQPVIQNYRGGSGGSGAGGSVVIVTKDLVGSVSGKIDVQGGPALSRSAHNCGFGPGYGGGGGVGRWVVKTSSNEFKSN